MFATDEDALICDLAETYHIYNYRSLPVQQVAILCIGLRDDSRIKIKLSGNRCATEILLLASIVDYLALLFWAQTKDGHKGINRPTSVVNNLLNNEPEKEILVFNTAEEFENKRKEIIGEGGTKWS